MRSITDTILANVEARKTVTALLELAGEQPEKFWRLLIEVVSEKLPPKPTPVARHPPMTEQEAIHFESGTMPYGKHEGRLVGCVEPDYLLFLTEGDEFSKRLRRYVKSKRFQDRQEE